AVRALRRCEVSRVRVAAIASEVRARDLGLLVRFRVAGEAAAFDRRMLLVELFRERRVGHPQIGADIDQHAFFLAAPRRMHDDWAGDDRLELLVARLVARGAAPPGDEPGVHLLLVLDMAIGTGGGFSLEIVARRGVLWPKQMPFMTAEAL